MDDLEKEDVMLAAMVQRREEFERAYYHWVEEIGSVDSDDEAIVAALIMKGQWREITAALDRRFKRMP